MPKFSLVKRKTGAPPAVIPKFGDLVEDEFGWRLIFLWDDDSSGYDNEHWVSVIPLNGSTSSEPMLFDRDRLRIIR